MTSWEQELRDHFPAYLLPATELRVLPRETAERFLACLYGTPDALNLLLSLSALTPIAELIREFAKELPLLARELPSRTEDERIESEGHIRGRLDVPATLRRNLAGGSSGPNRIVSRVRERRFDLPENVLVIVTANRLMERLARLEERGAIARDSKDGWSVGFRACAEDIRQTLTSTALCRVPQSTIEPFHEQVARSARHRAYGLALQIHEAMKSIETRDPVTIARIVSDGALAPLKVETRFEIAVLIRLCRFIERATGCTAKRTLIERDRNHVFEFSARGDSIRLYYNQRRFDTEGPRDRGVQHYFGERGRLRPDITIEYTQGDKLIRAIIVEAKHSNDKDYLKNGYEQALLYRSEYAHALTGWPKVILVASGHNAIHGAPRREDEVIATSWKEWVPDIVLEGLMEEASQFGFTNSTAVIK